MVICLGFPGGTAGKNAHTNSGEAGDSSSIPGFGRYPGGGNGNPHQHSCLGNPTGQRSLAVYIPGGCKESDMTKLLSTHTYCFPNINNIYFSYFRRLGSLISWS